MPKFMIEHDDKLKKECVRKMQQGSLHRFAAAPFTGKSVTHETFVKPKGKVQEKCKPVDEVS